MESVEDLIAALNAKLNECAEFLRLVKDRLGLRGDVSETIEILNVVYPAEVRGVKVLLNKYDVRLNFDDLDSGLNDLSRAIDANNAILLSAAKQGYDFVSVVAQTPKLSTAEKIKQLEGREPELKMATATLGPNWSAHIPRVTALSGSNHAPSDKLIGLNVVKPHILRMANDICSHWKRLQSPESQRKLESFRAQWGKLQPLARCHWLQQFPQLHQRRNMAVYMLAKTEPLDRGAFLTPLLNVEDLAQANVLPDMLQIRSITHPKVFLPTDSGLVNIGYWSEKLTQMKIAGRVSFFFDDDGDKGQCPYGVQFEPNAFEHPRLTNPILALYQLESQDNTYQFLASCLSPQMELEGILSRSEVEEPKLSTPKAEIRETDLTLLGRSGLSAYGRPDNINWPYLERVLRASAEEALDDLWQLRIDADYWLMRITESQRNTSSFLRCVFQRIDMFEAVRQQVDDCQKDHWTIVYDDVSGVPKHRYDANQSKGVIHMHYTLLSILNETLALIQDNAWSPRKTTNGTFRYVFDLIMKNDPALRVMGFDTALKTFEQELSDVQSQDPLPDSVLRAFHDMSVVAACMRETSQHFLFVNNFDRKYATLATNAAAEWMDGERVWDGLLQAILKDLQPKLKNINTLIRDEGVPLEERHRRFWNTIDICMRDYSEAADIVAAVRSHVVPGASRSPSPSAVISLVHREMQNPTQTQVKKSKGKKGRVKSTSVLRLTPSLTAPTVHRRPSVRIPTQKGRDFWIRVNEKKGQVSFKEFQDFLCLIGYSMCSQGGAGRRFDFLDSNVPHAIVFHALHGPNGHKIPHKLARVLWTNRLQKYVQVVLADDEDDPAERGEHMACVS